MQKFRKKPIVIEAVQLTVDNQVKVAHWCGGHSNMEAKPSDPTDVAYWVTIPTLEGVMRAELGDWVIKGVEGEFYPCKPAIFDATYSPVPEPDGRQRHEISTWLSDAEASDANALAYHRERMRLEMERRIGVVTNPRWTLRLETIDDGAREHHDELEFARMHEEGEDR